jgi:hypothetical protein
MMEMIFNPFVIICDVMTPFDLFLNACFAGFALLLAIISLKAYRRHGEPRLAIVTGSFAIYSLLAVLVLVAPFLGWNDLQMNSYLVILNLAILLSLYFALLKR